LKEFLFSVEDCELMGIMAIMVSALITANELKSKKRIFCLARRIEEAGIEMMMSCVSNAW